MVARASVCRLSGEAEPEEALHFLKDELIPEVVDRINSPRARRRMALYGGDRVPENERNLTDVRNRMSLLFEYKLAWLGNEILEEEGDDGLFWTYVVANRFPDLEVRKHDGGRGLRVEVKCLEAVAEEKSANFDTLKKDINPRTDFLVVFLWEWVYDRAAVAWDRAPKVLNAFVFHAFSLAELRDYNWLNSPPSDLGDGCQGFDLRYAVNCRAGVFNEEEGNYGKLLRIWAPHLRYDPGETPIITRTIQDYLTFEDQTVWSGFEFLARHFLSRFATGPIEPIALSAGLHVGFKAGNTGFVLRRRARTLDEQSLAANRGGVQQLIIMSDKYQWTHVRIDGRRATRLGEGRKPKHLASHLEGSLARSVRVRTLFG